MTSRRSSFPARLSSPVFLVTVLVLAGLAFAGKAYLDRRRALTPVVRSQVTLAVVEKGDLSRVVTTTGQLKPLIIVEVGTQISGLITEVNVDFGTHVKKGQVLAKIDSSTYEQNLRQLEANVAAGEANCALLKLNVERMEELRTKEMVAQQDYDRLVLEEKQAQATLLGQRASLENARLDLERCTITSPIDGVVIHRQAEVGKTVAANFNSPTLCVIAQDLAKMQLAATIGEADIPLIKPGMDASFTVEAYPGRTFQGKVRQIRTPYTPTENGAANPGFGGGQNPGYTAIIDVDNPELLLWSNMQAMISMVIEHRSQVLQIPNAALRVRPPAASPEDARPGTMPPGRVILGGGAVAVSPPAAGKDWAVPPPVSGSTATVYRLPHGKRTDPPEPVQVELGMSDSFFTEVVKGLNEGDTVVTSFGTVNPAAPGAR